MKILLATDGTKHSEAAADMVTKMKLGSEDSVRVISVVDMAVPLAVDIYGGYLPDTAELEKTARESAAKVVEDAIAGLNEKLQAAGVKVEGDVLFGSPDSRIVETAEDIHADLIVIGSHGYKRWERLLLGSVSHSVVHHAHCSVMVVRTDAAG
jgi:nucleotide-binding universal stress UspA family protein